MRSVVYFRAGTVADFSISDERFDMFGATLSTDIQFDEHELDKARQVLGTFMGKAAETPYGAQQEVAACFVWNYFNGHPDADKRLAGDIIILDPQGDGSAIQFAPVSEIEMILDS